MSNSLACVVYVNAELLSGMRGTKGIMHKMRREADCEVEYIYCFMCVVSFWRVRHIRSCEH